MQNQGLHYKESEGTHRNIFPFSRSSCPAAQAWSRNACVYQQRPLCLSMTEISRESEERLAGFKVSQVESKSLHEWRSLACVTENCIQRNVSRQHWPRPGGSVPLVWDAVHGPPSPFHAY